MAPASDDMADLDRPVTLRELRSELQAELQGFSTKLELRTALAELEAGLDTKFATKEELEAGLATLRAANEDLRTEMATGFAEMRGYVDFSVKSFRDELRTHFDVIAESLRADFRSMFDWMKANMTSVTTRVDALETGHGARLTTLEARVTKLEFDRN